MTLTNDGMLLVGDTANTGMTVGLTINQGANDDEILALKSSDIAHGITGRAETDTFATIKKWSPSAGGVIMQGLSEGDVAFGIQGTGTTDNTTKGTSATAYVVVQAKKKSGTSAGAVGANANLLAVNDNTNARFLIDAEGDTWQSGGATFEGAVVMMANLPTADPTNAGQLWNDSGTVKVSAG